MTIEQIRQELAAYQPATLPELIATEEHMTRRQALGRRLDALTRPGGGGPPPRSA